ncbi:MAG: hypothetical protein ACOYX1_05820 [Acidobacteriota bacterium]
MRRFSWRDAWLVLPALALMAWLDWHGLRSWFHQDDFAWLSLGRRVHSFGDLLDALFRPAAQGTVRVFSERLFFLGLERLFGLDHRPFHLAVLATQAANLALLCWITLKVTGSRLAAAAAPAIWAAGVGLAVPLAWLSAYNQVLCSFCLLAAFACLLRWLETGRRRWLAAQWVLLVSGFGVLEIVVVYPALAAAWCWLDRRRAPREIWWMWGASAVFAAAHMMLIPKQSEGVYARHWDFSMLRTYGQYWSLALGGDLGPEHWPVSWLPRRAAAAIAGLAAASWLVLAWKRGVKLAVFGFVWFTLVLAPVLPLRDHVSDYYLAVPSAGVAWIAATGLAAAWGRARLAAALALAVAALHLVYAGAAHRATAEWRYQRGLEARHLFLALERAVELHPGRLIVVSGVDNELYWGAFYDAQSLLPQRVCLDPRAAGAIQAPAGFVDTGEAFCAPAEIADAARGRRLRAYRWVRPERRLRAETRLYRHRLPQEWLGLPPAGIDTANETDARWLGEGWYQAEAGGRWTALRAVVTMAAPDRPGRQLVIQGYRPLQPQSGTVWLTVLLDGVEGGRYALPGDRPDFTLHVPLPAPGGRRPMRVELAVDRPIAAPGDKRVLGVMISRLRWR